MHFTDETVLLPATAVRDTVQLTTISAAVTGSDGSANLWVENGLDQAVVLHLESSRNNGASWREFDPGVAISVPAGGADLFTSNKALLPSYGLLRVKASCAAAPTAGTLTVALHVTRES